MSINYCTLASNTVDTFCGPRRGLVFAKLVAELHPPVVNPQPSGGGNPQQIRNTAAIAQILARQQQRPMFDIDDREPMVYEQPFISVTVELFGATGTQTIEVAGANVDIVTVTNFEFEVGPEIAVNITDFEIE